MSALCILWAHSYRTVTTVDDARLEISYPVFGVRSWGKKVTICRRCGVRM